LGFARIIGAVAEGRVALGLIIHEGQLTYADSGLREVADLGAWWGEKTGLPLPLGANAVRRDLDQRFGSGTMREVAGVLRRSIEHAMEHRERSIAYAMGFAEMNLGKSGGDVSVERVSRFVDMYVNDLTLDAGARGEEAIRRLLREGADAGLCPEVGKVVLVRESTGSFK
jgi:1,4-dihydroxy-6-naphthoate synthase